MILSSQNYHLFRIIKGRDFLLEAFEWAIPFGGIPILSVACNGSAEKAGARPSDVIIAATCDISKINLNALPKFPGVVWQLSSATTIEFDLSRATSPDFAVMFRALLGSPLTLTVARSCRPMPECVPTSTELDPIIESFGS